MKTKKITFAAVMIALSTAIMLSAYFPYLTYAIPCIASLPIMIIVIELDKKWAIAAFLASLLPIMLFCEPESKLIYTLIAGYYPILKAVIEKLNNLVVEFILKLFSFNVAFFSSVFLASLVMGIKPDLDGLEGLGVMAYVIFWVLAQVVFIMFDFCLTKMAEYYFLRLRKTVSKLLK